MKSERCSIEFSLAFLRQSSVGDEPFGLGDATGVRWGDGAKVPVCAEGSLIRIEKRRTGNGWRVANAHNNPIAVRSMESSAIRLSL